MDRREFLKRSGTTAAAWPARAVDTRQGAGDATRSVAGDRDRWIAVMRRLADPVLTNLANGTLKARMPVEEAAGASRASVTHLEAFGWLRIGLCGRQPGVGETYISSGSLYLCAVALLPLGLQASDAFWSAPPQPWTSARAWPGQPFPIDHSM